MQINLHTLQHAGSSYVVFLFDAWLRALCVFLSGLICRAKWYKGELRVCSPVWGCAGTVGHAAVFGVFSLPLSPSPTTSVAAF